MDMKYRGKHNILNEILAICQDGWKSKTCVMYDCHLSYTQLNQYLEFSQKKELLEKSPSGMFKTTDRGHKFLKVFQEIEKLLE